MKALKKLIPAAAMLVLCAAMMTTATFAWFTMNNNVSVNTINVDVSAPYNLQISKTQDSGWANQITDITGSTGNYGINPVTTTDMTTWKTTNKASMAGVASGALSTLTLNANGMCTAAMASGQAAGDDDGSWEPNKYFFTTYTVYLKNIGGEEASVYIDMTKTAIVANSATTKSDDLLKSVTFAIQVTGGKADTAKNQQFIQYNYDDATVGSTEKDEKLAKITGYDVIKGNVGATNDKPFVTIEAQSVVTVKVTAWMEGSSKYCNINNVKDATLKFDFSLGFATAATTVTDPTVT